jgi:hypothetical protein
VNDVGLNPQIFKDKGRGQRGIGENATHPRCRQEHVFRTRLGKKLFHGRLVRQIQFATRSENQIAVA